MNRIAFVCLPLILTLAGCSPTQIAIKIGMFAVGKAVDDQDTQQLSEKLIGKPPTAADNELGMRNDTFREVGGSTTWVSYPVKFDPLKKNQYFVEVRDGRITRIKKMEGSTGEIDFARSTVDKFRVQGKSPRECQDILKSGPPVLTVRSQNTRKLVQFYDGKTIVGVGGESYLILHFDRDQKCEKLQIVDVAASG